MTTEELLKPRWKCLGNGEYHYPESLHKPGDIIKPEYYIDKAIVFFNSYPHLFKPLQWWEEREASEMPKYVKFIDTAWKYTIGEMAEVFNWYRYPEACIYHNHFHADVLEPITETEYNSFINQKPKTNGTDNTTNCP